MSDDNQSPCTDERETGMAEPDRRYPGNRLVLLDAGASTMGRASAGLFIVVDPVRPPSAASEQLQALEDVGFDDVDCFYKHGVLAVFGGTRP